MRLFAILLLLLMAGLGFALWQGIDLGTGRLAGAPEKMGVEEVELTAADPGAIEAAPEKAPAVADAPAEAAEAPANDAEAPAETAEAPATDVPVETAAAPEPETPMPAEIAEEPAPETAAVEAPATPEVETAEADGAEAPAPGTAEAPISPEPATDTAAAAAPEAPAPRTLPENPLDPGDALSEIAPDLSVPGAPPVRSVREPAEEPAVGPSATTTNLASAAPDARRVSGDRVNLRQGPDAGTGSLGLLSRDDAVEVLESEGDWLRVRTEEGEEGWVAARFLAAPPG